MLQNSGIGDMSKVKLVLIAVLGLLSIAFFVAFAFTATYRITYSPNDWGINATIFPYASYVIYLWLLGLASARATIATVFVPERFFLTSAHKSNRRSNSKLDFSFSNPY